MGKISIATGVLAIVGAATALSQAQAHGALAIGGNPAEAAQKGIAFGGSYNYPDEAAANTRAMAECEKYKAAQSLQVECKIVMHFSHEWLAVALDPAAGTPGFGWSVDADQETAERNALAQCQATSPDDRKPYCQITTSQGDDTP
jgi:hypothetical protein